MKRLKQLQITFKGVYKGSESLPEEKLFEILSNPSMFYELMGANDTYRDYFEQIEYQDRSIITKTHEVMEWVYDLGEEENEVIFGFVAYKLVKKNVLKKLFKEVIEPLVAKVYGEDFVLDKGIELYATIEEYKKELISI